MYVQFDKAEESLRRLTNGPHDMTIVRERRPWEPGGAGHGMGPKPEK
jgi:hypothetical protein